MVRFFFIIVKDKVATKYLLTYISFFRLLAKLLILILNHIAVKILLSGTPVSSLKLSEIVAKSGT